MNLIILDRVFYSNVVNCSYYSKLLLVNMLIVKISYFLVLVVDKPGRD